MVVFLAKITFVILMLLSLMPFVFFAFEAKFFNLKPFSEAFTLLFNKNFLTNHLSWAFLSFKIATISTGFGFFIQLLHLKIGQKNKLAYILLILSAGVFFISPYICAQGWINFAKSNGFLLKILPEGFQINIFSKSGLVFFLVIRYTPICALFLMSGANKVPRAVEEMFEIFPDSKLKRFYYLFRIKYFSTCVVAFTCVYLASFWNYEWPSILRIDSPAINLAAKFGSFFNYQSVFKIIISYCILNLPFILILIFSLSRMPFNLKNSQTINYKSRSKSYKLVLLFLLTLLLLFNLIVPLIGIVPFLLKIPENIFPSVVEDFRNTVLSSGLTAIFLTLLVVILITFILPNLNSRLKKIPSFLLLIITLSHAIYGIGYSIFRQNITKYLPIINENFVGLSLLYTVLFLPVVILLATFFYNQWPTSWENMLSQFYMPFLNKIKIKVSFFSNTLLFTLFAIFLLMAIEIPATLLNAPPGISTLALSIETMLHFDQAEIISWYCFAQLLIGIITGITLAIFIKFINQNEIC